MAHATTTYVEPTYTLTITQVEAQTLRDILDNVGGDPDMSRRCYAEKIKAALESVGVTTSKIDDLHDNSAIYFK